MQLDVFHALWELFRLPRHRRRPAAESTRSERLAADRTHALPEVPIGTMVWQDFLDQRGRIQRGRTEVYHDKTSYWRVRHKDRDREELTRTEIEQGRDPSLASAQLTSKVSK